MNLNSIADDITNCTACGLCKRRDLPVPGTGPATADIVFIGEGPGNEDDLAGLPFVGPSGKLLTRLMRDVGISRDDVFITNVVKCRPENNRQPTSREAVACRVHLQAQLAVVQPKVIVTLGRPAAQFCTGHYGPIQGLQAIHGLQSGLTEVATPVVVAYHPSYLLRLLKGGPADKARAKLVYDNFKAQLSIALAVSRGEIINAEDEDLDLDAMFS